MLLKLSQLTRKIRRFGKEDDGAMTVEWTAIAAAVVIGAVAITYQVLDGLDPVAETIGSSLSNVASPPADPPNFDDGL